MNLQRIREKAEPILKKNGITFAGVFGSRARNEYQEDSDLDILVRFESRPGFFDFVRMERELSQQIGLRLIWSQKSL